MARILVFGDSISYGAWDLEGGWVQRLRKWLDKKVIDSNYEEYFIVHNLGIGGDTAEGVLKRFESETKARVFSDESEGNGEDIIFIFSIGGNDSVYVHEKSKTEFTKEEFRENLNNLIKLAKKYSNKIILKEETPIDEPLVDPMPWATGYSYKKIYLEEFNDVIKSVAKENKVYLIELYDKFESLNYKELLADGCHPTTEGHEKIFEIVKDYLVKNKIL